MMLHVERTGKFIRKKDEEHLLRETHRWNPRGS